MGKEIIGQNNFLKFLHNTSDNDYRETKCDSVTFFIKNTVIKDTDLVNIEKEIAAALMIKNKGFSLVFKNCELKNVNIVGSCLDSLTFERCKIDNMNCVKLVLDTFAIGNEKEKINKLTLNRSSIEYLVMTGEDIEYMKESMFSDNKIERLFIDTLDLRCNMAKNNKIRYIAKIENVMRGW